METKTRPPNKGTSKKFKPTGNPYEYEYTENDTKGVSHDFLCYRKYVNGKMKIKTFRKDKYTPETLKELAKHCLDDWAGGASGEPLRTGGASKKEEPKNEIPRPEDNIAAAAPTDVIVEVTQVQQAQPQPTKQLFEFSTELDLELDEGTGNSTLLLASSKQGKSTILRYLYLKYYRDAVSVLFTENPHLKYYKDKNLIVSKYYFPEVIKAMHKINVGVGKSKKKSMYDFCVLTDDVVFLRDDETLKRLLLMMRNANLSSVISMQGFSLVSKISRSSVNNLVFGAFNSDDEIKSIIEKFLSSYIPGRNISDKIQVYKELTRDHKFLYLSYKTQGIKWFRLNIGTF